MDTDKRIKTYLSLSIFGTEWMTLLLGYLKTVYVVYITLEAIVQMIVTSLY